MIRVRSGTKVISNAVSALRTAVIRHGGALQTERRGSRLLAGGRLVTGWGLMPAPAGLILCLRLTVVRQQNKVPREEALLRYRPVTPLERANNTSALRTALSMNGARGRSQQ
ncbi:unnamed protein product [Gadus morhua 'NCC']